MHPKPFILFRSFKIAGVTISMAAMFWFLLAIIAVIAECSRGPKAINNYLIFKGVFEHTVSEINLYAAYPNEYEDSNHYGPLFSLLIGPFAMMPLFIGCFFWCVFNAAFLFYAIKQLPFTVKQQQIVMLIGLVEMMTSIHNVQFNPMLTAWIILSYTYVSKGKDIWATFFIAAGFLIKIYGIVGLLFFLFSRNKIKFVLSFLVWMIVLFCLPMLISSPHFIVHSYEDWWHSLIEKDQSNKTLKLGGNMQDISVMGLIRRPLQWENFRNFWVMVPAAILICFPLLRFKQYKYLGYQLTYLSVVLLSTVLFSSSAESATYVIAVTGAAIWFVLQNNFKNKWLISLLVFMLVLTCLSPTDLFPRPLFNAFVKPYALKALPCFVIWLVIVYQLLKKDFSQTRLQEHAA